jgi:hypothetical protein
MVDMDKGVYGQEYNVSLFIHVNSFIITASHSLFAYVNHIVCASQRVS